MMYESIITQIAKMIDTEIEGQLMKTVGEIGFEVDKEELVKLLKNDRDQYEKGYQDACKRYKWHDLCKDPKDLPEDGEEVLCITENSSYAILYIDSDSSYYEWKPSWIDPFDCIENRPEYVKAWKYIEPIEGGSDES